MDPLCEMSVIPKMLAALPSASTVLGFKVEMTQSPVFKDLTGKCVAQIRVSKC